MRRALGLSYAQQAALYFFFVIGIRWFIGALAHSHCGYAPQLHFSHVRHHAAFAGRRLLQAGSQQFMLQPSDDITSSSLELDEADYDAEVAWLTCMQPYSTAASLTWVLTFCFFYYAATRRMQMRRRFNLAGEELSDRMAWMLCGPCALCQESRTLAANNVENGVWAGPAFPATVMGTLQPMAHNGMPMAWPAGAVYGSPLPGQAPAPVHWGSPVPSAGAPLASIPEQPSPGFQQPGQPQTAFFMQPAPAAASPLPRS